MTIAGELRSFGDSMFHKSARPLLDVMMRAAAHIERLEAEAAHHERDRVAAEHRARSRSYTDAGVDPNRLVTMHCQDVVALVQEIDALRADVTRLEAIERAARAHVERGHAPTCERLNSGSDPRWDDECDCGLNELAKALGDAAERPAPLDPNRCAVCGGVLYATRADGCVRGDCTVRPKPKPDKFYDLKRACKEYALRLEFDAPKGDDHQ